MVPQSGEAATEGGEALIPRTLIARRGGVVHSLGETTSMMEPGQPYTTRPRS